MKYLIVILTIFRLSSALCSQEIYQKSKNKDIEALAKEYTQLKAKRKALAPGVFDKDLSGAGGRLQQVLSELGLQLGIPDYRREDIIRLMGQPDAVMRAGDYQPGSLGHSATGSIISKEVEHLVYFWRGWHDYLYFISKNGTIQRTEWYFAGE